MSFYLLNNGTNDTAFYKWTMTAMNGWAVSQYGQLQKIISNTAKIADAVGYSGSYAQGGIATGSSTGYMATLHGTELIVSQTASVPASLRSGAASGYNDPEVKTLLKGILASQNQKQKVTLVLDNGKELSGYIRSEADTVRVSANERQGISRRRLYN